MSAELIAVLLVVGVVGVLMIASGHRKCRACNRERNRRQRQRVAS